MTESAERLRTASDLLLRDLEALIGLEGKKRTLSPDDPVMLDLAAQIRELAHRVLVDTKHQEVLAQKVSIESEIGDAPAIDETPRSIPAILAAWRDAERRLEESDPETPEGRALRVQVDHLRSEYRRAHEERERRT
jgi:hypothetical protein